MISNLGVLTIFAVKVALADSSVQRGSPCQVFNSHKRHWRLYTHAGPEEVLQDLTSKDKKWK